MISLKSFIDFNDFSNFSTVNENKYTLILSGNKNSSPFKKYIFKIFNFPCNSPNNQNIILDTYCQINIKPNQYLINFKKISFSYHSKNYPALLSKYISSKTLEQIISKTSHDNMILNEIFIYNCLFAVTEAMCHLHGHIICHGNLCPSNIILDKLNQFYLCDFGLYPIKKLYYDKESMFNKIYQDPLMQNGFPSFKSDIYSFGILMCHLFFVYNQTKNNDQNQKETLEEFIENSNPDKYSEFPKFITELIQSCLNPDISKRPSFKQINEIFKTVQKEENSINVSHLYSKFIETNYNQQLAKMDDPQALNKLGEMHADQQKSLKFYKKASNMDYSEAQSNYGVMLQNIGWENKPNLKEGAKKIRESAEQGNIHGMFNYGIVLIGGFGVTKDIDKGMEFLKKAADKGYAKAQEYYAYKILISDNPSPEKVQEGLNYIKKAISQNFIEAFWSYGCILKIGKNIDQNLQLAMNYFKIAADNGNFEAMMEYADGNLNGIGVPKNEKIARKYYQLALANGNENAKIKLDIMDSNQNIENE